MITNCTKQVAVINSKGNYYLYLLQNRDYFYAIKNTITNEFMYFSVYVKEPNKQIESNMLLKLFGL